MHKILHCNNILKQRRAIVQVQYTDNNKKENNITKITTCYGTQGISWNKGQWLHKCIKLRNAKKLLHVYTNKGISFVVTFGVREHLDINTFEKFDFFAILLNPTILLAQATLLEFSNAVFALAEAVRTNNLSLESP